MTSQMIGTVKSGRSGTSYEVKWDSSSKDVYVSLPGWISNTTSYVGKASSPREAMNKAEAWLYNK